MTTLTYIDFTHIGAEQLTRAPKGKGLKLSHFVLGNEAFAESAQPAECKGLVQKGSIAQLTDAQISGSCLRVQGLLGDEFANKSFSFSEIGLFASFSDGETFLLAYNNVSAPLADRGIGQMSPITERQIDIIVTLNRDIDILPISAMAKKEEVKWAQKTLSAEQFQCSDLSVETLELGERMTGDCLHFYADRACSLYIQEAKVIGMGRNETGESHDLMLAAHQIDVRAEESFQVKVNDESALRLVYDEMAGETAMQFELAQGNNLELSDLMMSSRLQVAGPDYSVKAPAMSSDGKHLGALQIEGGLLCDKIQSSSLSSGISISMDEQKKAHMTGHFGALRFVVSVEDTSPSGVKGVFLKILCGGAAVNAKRGVILQLSMTTVHSDVPKSYQRLYIADITTELSQLCFEKLEGKLDELKRIDATVFVL